MVGPDAAGRSALIRMLATLVAPSSGRMTVGEIDAMSDPFRVRRLIAYAGCSAIAANRLRVGEHLHFVAAARRQPHASAAAAAALVRLDSAMPIEALDHSQQHRLAIAAACASGAELMLFDEVLDTLDIELREKVFDWLNHARTRGTTVIVNGCDRIDVNGLCPRTLTVENGCVSEIVAGRGRPTSSHELVSA
jgi:ABC-type multidrug transport system ATPase subunit